MANDSFKVKKALNIEPNSAPNLSTDGDIGFNSSDSNLELYTGGSVKKVLTNSQAQVVTAKDIDGGTASNTSRITLPKSDKATLDALTRKEGTIVYATDQQKAFLDNGSVLTEVGSGSGGGGINYVLNPDAEVNTDGWEAYADAAGTAPVDGTGGSPTLTLTRSTSSPLRGDGSFLITKDAADRQGEGAAYPFEIDSADQGKVMQITFDYAIASGTYATGDLAVYVIHDPNGTPKVIQPSGYQIENVGVNSVARMTFQTEVSAQLDYTLCFHVASTSSSAYTCKLDNIVLGPQVVPQGAPVTDWVSYTPTGSWVTNTTYAGKWRRVGDTAEYEVFISLAGAPTATALDVNLVSGHVIDSSKLSDTTPSGETTLLGIGKIIDTGVIYHLGKVQYSSSTAVRLAVGVDAGSGYVQFGTNSVSSTVPFSFGNTDAVVLNFKVPIVGWSSSTVVSSSADTRVVAARATNGSNITLAPNNSFVKVTGLDTKTFDTAGAFDTSQSRYTAVVPGLYDVSGQLATGGTNTIANVAYLLSIYKNGSLYQRGTVAEVEIGGVLGLTVSGKVQLNAGDYVELYFYGEGNNSASTVSATSAVIAANLIQGPSQIAASEVIQGKITTTGTPTVNPNNSYSKVPFNSVVSDSHGGWNTASNRYVVGAPGSFSFDANIVTAGTNVLNALYFLAIYKNGSLFKAGNGQYPPATSNMYLTVTGFDPSAVVGDYYEVFLYGLGNNSVNVITIFTGASTSSFSVSRLGGVM